MTFEQKILLAKIATAIVVEIVKEAGNQGAPAGHLYAALMPIGMTLEQFEQIMAGLVACKMLRKSGQLYYYVAASASDKTIADVNEANKEYYNGNHTGMAQDAGPISKPTILYKGGAKSDDPILGSSKKAMKIGEQSTFKSKEHAQNHYESIKHTLPADHTVNYSEGSKGQGYRTITHHPINQ